MKTLPTGLQVFEIIREKDGLYVDKTDRIYNLVSGIKTQFFLSRPRRFGKTLLCWTLNALFSGKKELFDGLAISGTDWDFQSYPVIHLDMSKGDFSQGADFCRNAIQLQLKTNAKKLEIDLNLEDSLSIQFSQLIYSSAKKYGQQAVVLIDEYDNPLLSVIDKPEEFDKVRSILRDFYKTVKSSEPDLRFAFLTGITKFSKVSIFSALNNLNDITLDPKFADICGITQAELESDFTDYIEQYADDYGGKENYLMRLKDFYNGYRFSDKKLTVYNPFGLLKHFDSGKFNPYWFESGTPTFLMNLIDKDKTDILTIKDARVTEASFRRFDIDNVESVPMLYQTGYLTIADYDNDLSIYTLDYPNSEVRGAFSDELAVRVLKVSQTNRDSLLVNLTTYLYGGDITSAMELAIKPFMAEIPNDLAIRHEKYFQTIFHIIFNMLGLKCRSEVSIATGRIDALVETPKFVYCFEFKLDKTAEDALRQIEAKDYLAPYKGSSKTIFKIGVNFNYQERRIEDWVFEKWEFALDF